MDKSALLEQLQQLSQEYYYNEISFEEYRKLRRELLKKIDAAYNSQN